MMLGIMLFTGCLQEDNRVKLHTEEISKNILQQEISDLTYKIKNNEHLSDNVQLTKNRSLNLEEILHTAQVPMFENFVKIEIPDNLRKNPQTNENMDYLLEIDLNDTATSVLAYHEDREIIEYIPFSQDEEKKLELNLDSDSNISIMPVITAEDPEIEAEKTRYNDPYMGITFFSLPDKKPLRIVTNDGKNLKLQFSQSYFTSWWMGKKFTSCKVSKNGRSFTGYIDGTEVNIPITESGIYRIEVYAGWKSRYLRKWRWRWKKHHNLKWKQDIYVQKAGELPSNIDELAKKYSPIVVKDYSEKYNPSSLEYIYNDDESENFELDIPRGNQFQNSNWF